LRYGALVAGALLIVAVAGTFLISSYSNEHFALLWILGRLSLFAVIAGSSAALGRLICKATYRTIWTFQSSPGDYGYQVGLFAALLLIGWHTQKVSPPENKATPGPAMELAGPTLDGKTFNIEEMRGKVVLVDFWATWCGPCRAELPNIKRLYRRYHDRGLEIVGVSLDSSDKDLARFVKDEEIPWPQIIFENSRDNNPLALKYGVDAIPHTYLVDREGKIVVDNLRDRELAGAVAEQFDESLESNWSIKRIFLNLIGWILTAVVRASPVLLAVGTIGSAAAGAGIEAALRGRGRR
jgi:thiol-disulfide isomerase/thioredoxin